MEWLQKLGIRQLSDWMEGCRKKTTVNLASNLELLASGLYAAQWMSCLCTTLTTLWAVVQIRCAKWPDKRWQTFQNFSSSKITDCHGKLISNLTTARKIRYDSNSFLLVQSLFECDIQNGTINCYFSHLIEQKYLDVININFMIVGHTHAPIDQIFSPFTKIKRKASFIGTPAALFYYIRTHGQGSRSYKKPVVYRQLDV